MNKEDIYVSVSYVNFWWGIYGLSPEWDWEDVLIYPDRSGMTEPMAYFCLCSRAYFKNCIDDSANILEEGGFEAKVKRFLEESELQYHFTYDDPTDADFREVPYEAPRNELHVKPSYIELWYPAEGIGIEVLRHSVEVFCRQFLNKNDIYVHMKEMMSFEEAMLIFEKESKRLASSRNSGLIAVTEGVIEEMIRATGKTPEEIVKIISRSAGRPVEVKKREAE